MEKFCFQLSLETRTEPNDETMFYAEKQSNEDDTYIVSWFSDRGFLFSIDYKQEEINEAIEKGYWINIKETNK